MRSHNHPISNRRKWRRQRTARVALIVAASMLLLFFVAFVIVGNILLDKTAYTPPSSEETAPPVVDESASLPEARKIQALSVLAETKDSSTFSSRLSKILESGANAASIPMNTATGKLLYRSPVAEQMGIPAADAYSVTLTQVAQVGQQAGIHLSGVYTLTAFGEEDDLLRSVALTQAGAIAAEAIRSGMNDVLFLIPDLTVADTEELIRFLDGIRQLEPTATLGVSLSPPFLAEENSDGALASLYKHVSFLALDATKDGGATAEDVDAIIHDTQNHYLILYYDMRLLLPTGADDAATSAIAAVAKTNGFTNWQTHVVA